MPDEKSRFEDIRILDNFYQTSSFFPMPVVLVSTVSPSGQTNLGPYSLCFPYRVAGEKRRAMKLIARADSNTAKNIRRTGLCAINFIPDDKKYLENCVMLGFPGETTEEKMKNSIFTLQPSHRTKETGEGEHKETFPEIVAEAFQVFECRVSPEMPIEIDEETNECHIILVIEKILLKPRYKKTLLKGSKDLPRVPVDFGFRNNAYFWFMKSNRPFKIAIPETKKVKASSVKFAAERCDPNFIWTEEACERLVKVPRIFLTKVIREVNAQAEKEGITTITPDFLAKIRDKRSQEKN